MISLRELTLAENSGFEKLVREYHRLHALESLLKDVMGSALLDANDAEAPAIDRIARNLGLSNTPAPRTTTSGGAPRISGRSVKLWCDGSCLGNPGPGGWGVHVNNDGAIFEDSGKDYNTTNNRMELMAAIKSVEMLTPGTQAKIHCDSQYVIQGVTKWIPGWKRRNWRTTHGGPVVNKDLWERLDSLCSGDVSIEWLWVKGHSGEQGNTRADQLAKSCAKEAERESRGRNSRS